MRAARAPASAALLGGEHSRRSLPAGGDLEALRSASFEARARSALRLQTRARWLSGTWSEPLTLDHLGHWNYAACKAS